METAEQATATLHRNVKPELKNLGHQQVNTIPPVETRPLEHLKEFGIDARDYGEALLHEATLTSHSRVARKNPLAMLRERFLRKGK